MKEQAEVVELDGTVAAREETESAGVLSFRKRSTSKLPSADLVLLGALVAVLAFLWGRAAWMSLWTDEGIAVGVASHSVSSIPRVLLQESSPPLYYMILHGWIALFGSSDASTHFLSLLFALATVGAALWAGWSLFDRRTGWMCALVVAINPFIAYYATETRMYSMAILLALLSTATFIQAFVFRRRRYLLWFAVCQALLMYTHNWGLLVALAGAVALLFCLIFATDRRRLITDAILGFGAVGLLYAPWIPSVAYQIRERLHPWGDRADLVLVRDHVAEVLGGNDAFVALGLGAGIGLVALFQRRRWNRTTVAVVVLALIPAVTLLLGWRVSVWAYRYLAVVVGPLVLLAAIGLARAGSAALAALGVAAFLSAPLGVKGPEHQKSNAEAVVAAVSARLGPGDLVIAPDFEMVPLLAHYLPEGLRYVTTSGPVRDKRVVDWRQSIQRLLEHDPAETLTPFLDSLPPGGHVLLVCPPLDGETEARGLGGNEGREDQQDGALTSTADPSSTTAPPGKPSFHGMIGQRCRETIELVTNHPSFEMNDRLQAPEGVLYTAVHAHLLTKRPVAGSRPG